MDTVLHWHQILEEYGPEVVYIQRGKNSVYEMISDFIFKVKYPTIT